MTTEEQTRAVEVCQAVMRASNWTTQVSRVPIGRKWFWQVDANRRGTRVCSRALSESLAWMAALQKTRRLSRADHDLAVSEP